MIRGLYFKLHGIRIPQNYQFEVQRLDPLRCMEGIESTLKMGYYARLWVGPEFFANLMVSDRDPFATLWLFCFYESIWIFAETSLERIKESGKPESLPLQNKLLVG